MAQPITPGIGRSRNRRNQCQYCDLQAVQSRFAAWFVCHARREVDITYELSVRQCGNGGRRAWSILRIGDYRIPS